MVDIISLARHLTEEFPVPEGWGAILLEIGRFLNLDEDDLDKLDAALDEATKTDAYRVLVRKWTRAGWAWDNNIGAVLLEDDERATFEDNCITLEKGHGGSLMVFSLAHGEKHDRILWF